MKDNKKKSRFATRSSMPVTEIGLIGYGKFTILMQTVLKSLIPDVQIKISSRSQTLDNITFFEFDEVASCDWVIPSVPIHAFESTIRQLSTIMKPGATLVDICSIMMHPRQVCLQNLSEDINIICTHPNFGPESYRLNGNKLDNLNFLLEYTRCDLETRELFEQFLKLTNLKIKEMSAEEHDQKVGVPHFVSMFQGLLINELGLVRYGFGAASTEKMFDMAEGVGKDIDILRGMYEFNPYCQEYLDKINTGTNKISNILKTD